MWTLLIKQKYSGNDLEKDDVLQCLGHLKGLELLMSGVGCESQGAIEGSDL